MAFCLVLLEFTDDKPLTLQFPCGLKPHLQWGGFMLKRNVEEIQNQTQNGVANT